MSLLRGSEEKVAKNVELLKAICDFLKTRRTPREQELAGLQFQLRPNAHALCEFINDSVFRESPIPNFIGALPDSRAKMVCTTFFHLSPGHEWFATRRYAAEDNPEEQRVLPRQSIREYCEHPDNREVIIDSLIKRIMHETATPEESNAKHR